ncbi:MAG: FkbM family methyltransferase [Nitrososphaeria archaeon]
MIIYLTLFKTRNITVSLLIKKFLWLCFMPFLSNSFSNFLILLFFVLFRVTLLPLKFISIKFYSNTLFYLSMRLSLNKVLFIFGRKFFCRNFNDLLHIVPSFELQISSWFKQFKSKDNVFIDVGANVGRYTVLLAPFFKKVVSVEPDPYNFWVLRKNVLLNDLGNVILFRVGCFSVSGEGILHLSPKNFGSHSLKDKDNFAGCVRVPLKRLDDILGETNVSYWEVGLIKIDVEGVEEEVLLGATRLLSVGRPAIIVESLNVGRVFKVLSSYGYRLVDVDLVGHNFLFVKR